MQCIRAFFLFLFFFASFAIAADQKIEIWAKDILLKTLSVHANEPESELDKMRKYYTSNAWEAIYIFLGHRLSKINENLLTLHPVAVGKPSLIRSGSIEANKLFPDMSYWRINQIVSVPELNIRIHFSMLVIEPNTEKKNEPLIQSINIKL